MPKRKEQFGKYSASPITLSIPDVILNEIREDAENLFIKPNTLIRQVLIRLYKNRNVSICEIKGMKELTELKN